MGYTAARLRHAMFARHSNPWSAWTRWASTPLVLVPVWTRRRRDAALVAARRHHLRAAVIATIVQMALVLVYWELMARLFDRRPR